jgi:hypothetical protein
VTPSPQDFHHRAFVAADAEGRLPLPEQAMWEIFPFEPDSLRVKPLDPLTLRAHLDLGDLDDAMAAELGDGGAHLHAFLLGRPAGLLQLRGSNLALWEEMFPVVPAADVAAVVAVAVDALADLGESRL